MNVLLVGDSDTKFGASHSLCQLALALNQKKDVSVSVVLNRKSPMVSQLQDAGCRVYVIRYEPFYHSVSDNFLKMVIKYIIRGLQYHLLGRTILLRGRKALLGEKYDLVHSNSSREDIGAALARHMRVPLIWHIREFGDLDYKCYSYRKEYIRFMNSSADSFIAVSDAVREHWIRKGLDEKKIKTVYNGVSCPEGYREKVSDPSVCRLVIAGGLYETKGQLQAVEAVIRLNKNADGIKYKLDIIGDGDNKYIAKIKNIISSSSAEDAIRFLGYRSDVNRLLADYHIGLMCSKCEAFGRVTAEYMMSGLAVVASDTGANKELIREGVDGLLYQYGSTENLADRISEVFVNINAYGGTGTREYALKSFSSEVNADNIYKLYTEVLENRKLGLNDQENL